MAVFRSGGDGYQRFGGELPLGCDPLLPVPRPEPASVLGFSHGRAALGWLVERHGPVTAALICAYTCPSLPCFFRALGLEVAFFDVGTDADGIATQVERLSHHRVLVLVPALLGFDPWLDAAALARTLGPRAVVTIDAAQTAFGHRRYRPPPGGAVLSCPRKTTALADGACLVLDGTTSDDSRNVAALPEATGPTAAKRAARALFAERDPAREDAALMLAEQAEREWPTTPHRMTGQAARMLARLDAEAHERRRIANCARLRRELGTAGPPVAVDGTGVPFCHAVLVEDRAERLQRLRAHRVFATPLWFDSEHDPVAHPRAATLARHLLALPVDQRYVATDMDRLAELVRAECGTGARNTADKGVSPPWPSPGP